MMAQVDADRSAATLPKTMRAIQRVQYYGTDWGKVFVEIDLPVPQAGKGQVLVQVHASSVNSGDIKLATGVIKMFMKEKLPRVPGNDVAGVVAAVGEGVTAFALGDEVFGSSGVQLLGTYAEFAVAPSTYLTKKPAAMSWADAASLPVAGVTAVQAIKLAKVGPGTTVVVRGASGGVGSLVVQLARAAGAARIVAVSSKVEVVKTLGAHECVNYRDVPGHWSASLDGEGFDAVIDCVGGPDSWSAGKRMLKSSGGIFVPVSGDDKAEKPLGFGFICRTLGAVINRKFWSMFGYPAYMIFVAPEISGPGCAALAAHFEKGEIRAMVQDASFALTKDSVARMHEEAHDGHVAGKLVLTVVQPALSSTLSA